MYFGNRRRRRIDFVCCIKRTSRRRVAEISKLDETAASFLRFFEVQSQSEQFQANVEEALSLLIIVGLTKTSMLVDSHYSNLRSFKNPV